MEDYLKYRWFFTSSGILVVGGKSAEQNDSLLKKIKKENYIVMHTSHPGSPFSVIVADVSEVSKKDIEECAIFTGCFSRAWKEGKKSTEIHIFSSEDIYKTRRMKTGTWGVKSKVRKAKVILELALVKQKGFYRAVPLKTVRRKEILLKLSPGKIDKEKAVNDVLKKLKEKESKKEEILSALPAGGFKIS